MTDNTSALLIRAAAFAAQKHRNQRRKDADASPYINHPIALANVLANEAGITDPTVLAAALLHDTIEDTDTTQAELEAEFGPVIAAVVAEVTDDKSLPKAERKRLQVEHASHISRPAKLVNKICNLRDVASSPPADWPIERKREYFDWARSVADRMAGAHEALEALFRAAHASSDTRKDDALQVPAVQECAAQGMGAHRRSGERSRLSWALVNGLTHLRRSIVCVALAVASLAAPTLAQERPA